MGIHHDAQGMIVVNLSHRLEDPNELQAAVEMVRDKDDVNVVVDFSSVDVVGSRMLAALLELRQVLQESGHKLVLCGLSPATKGVFSIAHLDTVFEFVDDRFSALGYLQGVA